MTIRVAILSIILADLKILGFFEIVPQLLIISLLTSKDDSTELETTPTILVYGVCNKTPLKRFVPLTISKYDDTREAKSIVGPVPIDVQSAQKFIVQILV